MSRLNLCLILLAFGFWSSIYLLKFRENIERWYHTRFDKTPPPLPPDGKIPDVPLPFCYDPPKDDEEEAAAKGKETPAPATPASDQDNGQDIKSDRTVSPAGSVQATRD
ncbi:hypothetical protein [Asaia bogorensis]|uniref:hypothetical protein n=1 Tax=Asaia bogorensis TaxID=91915 RepID=UPI000EFCA1E7|nr:hypothetical protein [Asaia bogorensis]